MRSRLLFLSYTSYMIMSLQLYYPDISLYYWIILTNLHVEHAVEAEDLGNVEDDGQNDDRDDIAAQNLVLASFQHSSLTLIEPINI